LTAKKTAPPKYHHGDLRRAIMNAALEMTTESGLASLSLREIARRIGVTTAAPYHHFKDRQSLLVELAIEGYWGLFEAMSLALKNTKSADSEMEAAAVAYLHFGRSYPAQYAIMFSGELTPHPRAGEMMLVANRSLDLVRASLGSSGNLGEAERTEAAFCAWSLLHGILMLDRNTVLREDAAEQQRLAIRGVVALAHGFGAEKSTAKKQEGRKLRASSC
jgi:AcrR family transcriptional regulator